MSPNCLMTFNKHDAERNYIHVHGIHSGWSQHFDTTRKCVPFEISKYQNLPMNPFSKWLSCVIFVIFIYVRKKLQFTSQSCWITLQVLNVSKPNKQFHMHCVFAHILQMSLNCSASALQKWQTGTVVFLSDIQSPLPLVSVIHG